LTALHLLHDQVPATTTPSRPKDVKPKEVKAKEVKSTEVKAKTETKFPKKLVAILGGVVLLILVVVVIVLNLMGGGGGAGSVTEVKIPVNLQNAANIASLHLELTYDYRSLSVVSLTGGSSMGNAIYEYDLNSPGEILLGMVSSQGIKTDGSLMVITFRITTKTNTVTTLNLKNIIAYDGNTLLEVPTFTAAGSLNTQSGNIVPPTVSFRTR